MSIEATLSLPEDLYEDVKRWAALTGQDLSNAITYALTIGLNRTHTAARAETPVSLLPDEDVLALSRAQRNSPEGRCLTTLLENQCQGLLTEREWPHPDRARASLRRALAAAHGSPDRSDTARSVAAFGRMNPRAIANTLHARARAQAASHCGHGLTRRENVPRVLGTERIIPLRLHNLATLR